ncbi:glycosyltransferase [Oceanobacillus rekensis]|uniref:glycosyltransferase n=1 Tax=Oceanobacillus rekensis TaxID=937927 RepID=UPI000B44D816|nr:glycosyltransferase [Oceanobacillus rekensis]
MELRSIQQRLKEIYKLKQELSEEIKKELDFLKDFANINLDIDTNIGPLIVNEDTYTEKPLISKEKYNQLKDQKADKHFLDRVLPRISNIPESNGSKFFPKINVNIGIICDEFLFNSFKDVANFYYVKKNEYKELADKIDVLIVASAWKGLYEDWKGLANPNRRDVREELFEVIEFFRKQDVKIVFYSKEDPVNYDRFIEIATRCDYIFTTAVEKIADYKKDCKNTNVYPLEFSVNPIYNNPIGINNDLKDVGAIFAGSWYEKYPHRIKDSRILFDGVINAGNQLKIIDRNFDKDLQQHLYPPEYLKYISPSINHSTLQKIFKLFPWAINLNSVQASETMFANRVYELQAMGNLVLSNYSLGINNIFPNIFIVQNSNEVTYIMNNVSDEDIYRHRMYGVRKVLRNQTSYHRINKLLSYIGYDHEYITVRKVAVIVKNKLDNNIIDNFNRQTYEHKELLTEQELSANYNSYDYVTFFNEFYEYGEYYLEDMINAFKYTDVSYVTKDSYYEGSEKIDGIEHNYIDQMKDKYKSLFSTENFDLNDLLDIQENASLANGYSIDRLELNVNLIKNDKEANLKLSVIVPVYNNGEYLYGKCFMSLLRSSMFESMDIILVDDGSTDNVTINILDRLERLYSNVTVFKFEDGGSGSASRPRNKGLELAKTDYITYLDPDNEAVNDGYFHLFNELQGDNSLDLVVGDIIKDDTQQKVLNYSKNAFNWDPSGVVSDTYEFLKKSKMRAQSIQALIVKKDIIKKNNLKMVEKATGQDTLFFQELILNCSKIKAVDLVIHIYYAAVSNSVTNTISKSFFEKYLLLERARYTFLIENNLLETYIEKRFSGYFIGWYFSRIPRININDTVEGLEILFEIYQIYKPSLPPIIELDEPLVKFEKFIKKQKYDEFVAYCTEYFSSTVKGG